MTPTATADRNSLHAAALSPRAPTSSDAVRAVNDHRREVELRRMTHAAQQSSAASDWPVPVPRAQLEALEQQARDAVVLRGLLDSGPVIAVPFSALPPYTLREMPLSLGRVIGQEPPLRSAHSAARSAQGMPMWPAGALPERPLTRLFVAADVARLQQALLDSDATTLIAHLRRGDGRALRCSVHLAAADPRDPDWRWACIVRLPHAAAAQAPAVERHLPSKPNQRPRLDARPAPSA